MCDVTNPVDPLFHTEHVGSSIVTNSPSSILDRSQMCKQEYQSLQHPFVIYVAIVVSIPAHSSTSGQYETNRRISWLIRIMVVQQAQQYDQKLFTRLFDIPCFNVHCLTAQELNNNPEHIFANPETGKLQCTIHMRIL